MMLLESNLSATIWKTSYQSVSFAFVFFKLIDFVLYFFYFRGRLESDYPWIAGYMVWGDTHHCTRVSVLMSTSWHTTVGRIRAVVCPTNPTQVGIATRSIPAMKNTTLFGNEELYTDKWNPCIFRLVWWKLHPFPRGAAVALQMACSELILTGPESWELMVLGSVIIISFSPFFGWSCCVL